MQFGSWIFTGLFLPIVLIGYYYFYNRNNKKAAAVYLIICNLVFYGYAGIGYLIFLCAVTLINYYMGIVLLRSREKRWLMLGLSVNIGALAVLKYTNFFLSTLNSVFQQDFNLVHLFLPLGLSFFTFQFVAFQYDCYKGNITEISFLRFVLFSTFFPKIIQGPIMVYQDFSAQYERSFAEKKKENNLSKGLYAFALGLGKKILIADMLGKFVNAGFSSGYTEYNSVVLILLILSYTLQIYFDFSGYSDMAVGLGLMLNIRLPQNFNSPYKAMSINDFWKRWHMSLTSFFTKYLYIPLGGNRK